MLSLLARHFRLERLWLLLDSGSTPLTRRAAAEQIGQVQKLHPHELGSLLKTVGPARRQQLLALGPPDSWSAAWRACTPLHDPRALTPITLHL